MHLSTDTSGNAHFAKVPTISHSRNGFTVSEKHLTTMQFDYLHPMYTKYIYPGDTLSITQSIMARLQTQIAVLYDDLYFDAHAWFVPMRLIQTNWARYQFNAQPGGPSQDNSALTSPKIDLTTLPSMNGFPSKSLYDYLGFPTLVQPDPTEHINNYLGRAYNLIWNENYRDQNLQNPAIVELDEGPDNYAYYQLLKRGRRHDKFTSALTAQQKGPAVPMPLGTSAPIISTGTNTIIQMDATYRTLQVGGISGSPVVTHSGAVVTSPPQPLIFGNAIGLSADLANAIGSSVNNLRQSIVVQQLLEADARGGTRDVEAIANRWGVQVPDFRLQRPEYLGGSTFTFDGHVVPQTSETDTTPQGTLVQFSQTINHFNINHSFVEHGVFMILLSARSNMTYQFGLQRELSYRTRYDWYQPEFANLGEVAIKNKEIFFQGTSNDALNFGFQEYAYELRYSENRVTSEMRSNYAQSLDTKHMADDYASLPTLGSTWIQSDTPISRNIAVASSTADPIELNTLVSGKIVRTLPMYSVPGLFRL